MLIVLNGKKRLRLCDVGVEDLVQLLRTGAPQLSGLGLILCCLLYHGGWNRLAPFKDIFIVGCFISISARQTPRRSRLAISSGLLLNG